MIFNISLNLKYFIKWFSVTRLGVILAMQEAEKRLKVQAQRKLHSELKANLLNLKESLSK